MTKLDIFFYIIFLYQTFIVIVLSLPGLIYFFRNLIKKGSRARFSIIYILLHIIISIFLLYFCFKTELLLKINMDFIPAGILRFSFPNIIIALIVSILVFIYTKVTLKNGRFYSFSTIMLITSILLGIISLLLL